MGVKYLWNIIDDGRNIKTLEYLRGKTISVDLSIWIVEASQTLQFKSSIKKPHLRNMFFRILFLRRLGVKLIFVTEGDPPELKQDVMKKRAMNKYGTKVKVKGKIGRSRFQRTIDECTKMLDLIGIPHVRAYGEAEQLCATLNKHGLTDGCLTNDGDFFLYGGKTIYRDFGINPKDQSVLVYTSENIKQNVGINRNDMIGLALLNGCDYTEGLNGVGIKSVKKFLEERDFSEDLLVRFQQWRECGFQEAGYKNSESFIIRKAKKVECFWNEKVIDEFLIQRDKLDGFEKRMKFKYPHIKDLQKYLLDHLEWPEDYTLPKILQLATSTYLEKLSDGVPYSVPITPVRIVKTKCQLGVMLVDMAWDKSVDENIAYGGKWERCPENFVTLENQQVVSKALPGLVEEYATFKESKKKGSKKKKAEREPATITSTSTISQVHIVKQGSQASTVNVSKAFVENKSSQDIIAKIPQDGTTRPISQNGTTRQLSQDGTTRQVSMDGITRPVSQNSTTRPVTQNGTTRQVSQDGTTRSISQNGTTRQVSHDGTTRLVSQDGTTRQVSQDGTMKQVRNLVTKNENDDTAEQFTIGTEKIAINSIFDIVDGTMSAEFHEQENLNVKDSDDECTVMPSLSERLAKMRLIKCDTSKSVVSYAVRNSDSQSCNQEIVGTQEVNPTGNLEKNPNTNFCLTTEGSTENVPVTKCDITQKEASDRHGGAFSSQTQLLLDANSIVQSTIKSSTPMSKYSSVSKQIENNCSFFTPDSDSIFFEAFDDVDFHESKSWKNYFGYKDQGLNDMVDKNYKAATPPCLDFLTPKCFDINTPNTRSECSATSKTRTSNQHVFKDITNSSLRKTSPNLYRESSEENTQSRYTKDLPELSVTTNKFSVKTNKLSLLHDDYENELRRRLNLSDVNLDPVSNDYVSEKPELSNENERSPMSLADRLRMKMRHR